MQLTYPAAAAILAKANHDIVASTATSLRSLAASQQKSAEQLRSLSAMWSEALVQMTAKFQTTLSEQARANHEVVKELAGTMADLKKMLDKVLQDSAAQRDSTKEVLERAPSTAASNGELSVKLVEAMQGIKDKKT